MPRSQPRCTGAGAYYPTEMLCASLASAGRTPYFPCHESRKSARPTLHLKTDEVAARSLPSSQSPKRERPRERITRASAVPTRRYTVLGLTERATP
eukprot:scaffold2404_cov398-Prasinococcus_capsulatus_cf.AAC.32